jgi:hypothetical protein
MNQYHMQAGTIIMTPKIDEPIQMSQNLHGSPSHILGEGDSETCNTTYSSSCCGKNDEPNISSSSSGILEIQDNTYSGTDTNRNRGNETEPHSVSFEHDSSDNNYDCMQHTLHHNQTPQRRQRARNATVAALSSSSVAAAAITTSFLPPESPPKLCLGLSDLVDDALTRVADVMFDGMRCGMDDTCHRWTYVPGEDSP